MSKIVAGVGTVCAIGGAVLGNLYGHVINRFHKDFACAATLAEGAKAKGLTFVPPGGVYSSSIAGECIYTTKDEKFVLTYTLPNSPAYKPAETAASSPAPGQ